MSFFLRHFAGFLIQFGAGMLLCLIPFPVRVFRYPRKWIVITFSVLAVILSAGFPLAWELGKILSVGNLYILSNIYMLLAIAVFTILYLWVIRVETIKKLVVMVLVVFYAATQYLLVNLSTPLFPDGDLPDAYPPLTLALYAVTALVLFPVTAFLMKKAVGEYLNEIELKNIRREFSTVLAVTLLYFILLFCYSSLPEVDIPVFWWWVTPPLLLVMAILCIFYWTLFRESVRRKQDVEYQKTMEIQQLQYENITREMENARRMHHDMRHYLNALSELAGQGKVEEMKAFLSDVINNTVKRENEVYCKNTVVNGLLQYYVGLARNENIRCKVQADCGDLTISPADLTVLFGNAMENSICACRKVEGNRWITIQVGIIGGSLMVQISNPCKEITFSGRYQLDGEFLPASAFKSMREGGGYGLGSLENTAQKYGGDARFQYNKFEKTFTTQIRLNLHSELL